MIGRILLVVAAIAVATVLALSGGAFSEGEPPRCDVYAAATVLEEITFRGAHTVAATLAPDVAIALDVTHASDRPGVSPQEVGAHGCGSGAAPALMTEKDISSVPKYCLAA